LKHNKANKRKQKNKRKGKERGKEKRKNGRDGIAVIGSFILLNSAKKIIA